MPQPQVQGSRFGRVDDGGEGNVLGTQKNEDQAVRAPQTNIYVPGNGGGAIAAATTDSEASPKSLSGDTRRQHGHSKQTTDHSMPQDFQQIPRQQSLPSQEITSQMRYCGSVRTGQTSQGWSN